MKENTDKPTVPVQRRSVKEQKAQLMQDIASAKIKALGFKEEGNKRAFDSWTRVVKCLEKRLEDLKSK